MKRSKFLALGGMLGCLLLPLTADAQMYQWRDNNGRLVFSDTPPPPNIAPGNILKAPKVRPSAAPSPAAAEAKAGVDNDPVKAPSESKGPKTLVEREADYKKRQAEASEKAQKDQAKASEDRQHEEQCRGLRQNLAALEGGQRLRRLNDKGEPYFVEDAERARDVEKMRQDLSKSKCA